jgi:hypothetical protein
VWGACGVVPSIEGSQEEHQWIYPFIIIIIECTRIVEGMGERYLALEVIRDSRPSIFHECHQDREQRSIA